MSPERHLYSTSGGSFSAWVSLIPQVRPGNAWGFSLAVSVSPFSHSLQLSSQCKLLPSDFSLAGNASSSSPQPAGRLLAGFWCRAGAGVRSWDLLTWCLTGALPCVGRRAVSGWLLTASPYCHGRDHRITEPRKG